MLPNRKRPIGWSGANNSPAASGRERPALSSSANWWLWSSPLDLTVGSYRIGVLAEKISDLEEFIYLGIKLRARKIPVGLPGHSETDIQIKRGFLHLP